MVHMAVQAHHEAAEALGLGDVRSLCGRWIRLDAGRRRGRCTICAGLARGLPGLALVEAVGMVDADREDVRDVERMRGEVVPANS